VDTCVLGDEEIDNVQMKRIEERGIDFVVGVADQPEEPFQLGLVRLRLRVCAVKRRRFSVGARPTRQPLQPEAAGAAMEVTK
jgi:hypothetical protein